MKNLLYFILLASMLFESCDKAESDTCHHTIKIANNTDKLIYYTWQLNFPDTTLKYQSAINAGVYKIEKNSVDGDYYRDCWEAVFIDKSRRDVQKAMVYIFDAKTMETIPWDSIKAKNLYLKRYDLTLGDLQKANWIITYP